MRLNLAREDAESSVAVSIKPAGENETKELLVNEFSRYNLFLLRNIYDAYEEKGDRVVENFRKGNFNILKKSVFMMLSEPIPTEKSSARRKPMLEQGEDEHVIPLSIAEGDSENAEKLTGQTSANEDDPCATTALPVNRRRINKYGRVEGEEISGIEDHKDLQDTAEELEALDPKQVKNAMNYPNVGLMKGS